MKKNLLLFCFLILSVTGASAQTAADFTATDCNGNSHHLYSELDAGKVIVLCWVMPCAACINPSLTAYNIVQSYANPDVLFYLIDDVANTSCTTLSGWATNNGIGPNRVNFSTSSIVQTNYGNIGMPHIAVVGAASHTIYYNRLDGAAGNSTLIQSAINTALAATAIIENNNNIFHLTASSSQHALKTIYSLKEAGEVSLEVMNEAGQLVTKKEFGKQQPGTYTSEFDLSAKAAGVYFLRLTSGTNRQTVKFTVSN